MNGKVKYDSFFEKRGGEGPLALYFSGGPYGNAVEVLAGAGIGFFDETGKLLAVQFDRVNAQSDHQSLQFSNGTLVEISVKKGKISVIHVQLSPITQTAA